MTRHWRGFAGSILGLLLLTTPCLADDQPKVPKGTGEGVGETVDQTVETIKRGLRDTSKALHEQFASVQTSVHNMGVRARVYGRLHWDKDLNDANINLDVREDGVATLNGTVSNLKAKARAVDLADSTVGVSRVVDQLTVQPPTSKTTTTTTTTKTTKP